MMSYHKNWIPVSTAMAILSKVPDVKEPIDTMAVISTVPTGTAAYKEDSNDDFSSFCR